MNGGSLTFMQISYACFKIGAVVCPLNPAYTPDQVISALKHIEASCFVLSTEITLPYKEPKSTASLLDAVLGGVRSEVYRPTVLLIDNSACRMCSGNIF